MREIVVTAQRYEQDIGEVPQSMNVIDSRKLARDIPRTPAEALRDQPGIFVQKTSHIGGAPIIRGLMGNRVLLMVDGIRLNNIGAFSGPNNFLQMIDVENAERIEVVRGPGSVQYGSDALGGVVNVVTRAPVEWQAKGHYRLGGTLRGTFGSVDMQRRLRAQAYFGAQRFRIGVGTTLQEVDDLRGGGDIGLQHPSGWKERNFDARVDVRPVWRHELSASYTNLYQHDIQRYDSWLSANANVGQQQRSLARLSYRIHDPAPGLSSVFMQAYMHDQSTHELRIESQQTRDTRFLTPGADLQFQSPIRDVVLFTYGLHYHHDIGRAETRQQDGTLTRQFPKTQWDNGAAFLQIRITPHRAITAIVSGRYDLYHLSTKPDAASTPEGLAVDELQVDKLYNAGAGSLGLIGRVTEWLDLVGNLGNGFRAPSVSDSLSLGPFTNGYNVPSPNLRPEQVVSFDLGPRIDHQYVGFSAAYFHTWLIDAIQSEPGSFNGSTYIDINQNGMRDDKEDVYVSRNIGRGRLQGVEVAFEARLPPQWVFYGNFTYMHARNLTDDQPLAFQMPTNGYLAIRWQNDPSQRFYVEAGARFVARTPASQIPADRLERDPAYRVDPQDPDSPLLGGDGSVPGYWLLGANAGARINPFLSARLTASNLLNVEYRDKDSRINGPGMSVVASLTAEY
ncbi:TonB-dependent receptor plug domain-containing protein [Nannocystaceae bacterium ST9]